MTGRCRRCAARHRQAGAALAVALTLVAAVSLLAAATVRDTMVETAMTRNFAAQMGARVAAISALESFRAESALPLSGDVTQNYQIATPSPHDAVVTARFLGESAASPGSDDEVTSSISRHYEITVEVLGQRNTRHRRRLYRSVPVMQ